MKVEDGGKWEALKWFLDDGALEIDNAVGLLAIAWAFSPPALLTRFYSAAIGLLAGALFVPVVGGLWWKGVSRAGSVASFLVGAGSYLAFHFYPGTPSFAAILLALPASAVAMALGGRMGRPDPSERVTGVARLHQG